MRRSLLKSFSVVLLVGTSGLGYASQPLWEEKEFLSSSLPKHSFWSVGQGEGNPPSKAPFQMVEGEGEVRSERGSFLITPSTPFISLAWQECPEGDVRIQGSSESVVLHTFLQSCTLKGVWRSLGTLMFSGPDLSVGRSAVIEADSILLSASSLTFSPDAWEIKSSQDGFLESLKADKHGFVPAEGEGQRGKIHLSGSLKAQGGEGRGGRIEVLGKEITLEGAVLDASGLIQGGEILLGGTPPHQEKRGSSFSLKANILTLDEGSTLNASAQEGQGGRVVLWSESLTDFRGFIDAQGKARSVDNLASGSLATGGPATRDSTSGSASGSTGGFIEVSGRNGLVVKGRLEAGFGGTVLFDPKNIIITSTVPTPSGGSSTPSFNTTAFADPHPSPYNHFGRQVFVLPSGRFLVFSDYQSGAYYLYDALGNLIAENFVIRSYNQLGSGGMTLLDNEKVVICSPLYDSQRGVVLVIDGVDGSLLQVVRGENKGDQICSGGITSLGNGYLIRSPSYADKKGIVTYVDATQTFDKLVSELGGLKGSSKNDQIGSGGVFALKDGFVVCSPSWGNGRGAATWLSLPQSTLDSVSYLNSLMGSYAGDKKYGYPGDGVCSGGITVFPISSPADHNKFAVLSPDWSGTLTKWETLFFKGADNRKGAVTFCQADSCKGEISADNSFIGTARAQRIGNRGAVVLSNDCLVVKSSLADKRGAITKLCYSKNPVGEFDKTNSLMGENEGDRVGNEIYPLPNGAMLVVSPFYDEERGAITKFLGTDTPIKFLTKANSFLGQTPGDMVGNGGCITFQDGAWACSSFNYDTLKGAVTQGSSATVTTGNITPSNSLLGGDAGDMVGLKLIKVDETSFLVQSEMNRKGGVTYIEKATPLYGTINSLNSLIGDNPGDYLGSGGVSCPDLYCTVLSPSWEAGTGRVMVVDRTAASFTNSNPALKIITGDDVVMTDTLPLEDKERMHIAFENDPNADQWIGGSALLGSDGVSIISSSTDRLIYSGSSFNNRGLISYLNMSAPFPSTLDTTNSFLGTKPGDRVGNQQAVEVGSIAYALLIPGYNDGQGMVVYDYQTNPIITDSTTAFNITGTTTGVGKNLTVYPVSANGTFLISFPYDDNGAGDESGRLILVTPSAASGGGGAGIFLNNTGTTFFADNATDTMYINATYLADLLNTGASIILQANNDIIINDPISALSSTTSSALTLQAGRSILVNQNVTINLGNITFVASELVSEGVILSERESGSANITMLPETQVALDASFNDLNYLTFTLQDQTQQGDIVLSSVYAYFALIENKGSISGSSILMPDQNAVLEAWFTLWVSNPLNTQGCIGIQTEPVQVYINILSAQTSGGNISLYNTFLPPIFSFPMPLAPTITGINANGGTVTKNFNFT